MTDIGDIPSLTKADEKKWTRKADRRRFERRCNQKPRPGDDDLLAMYANLSVPQIASDLGYNENTVRSWINRARHRQWGDPAKRAAFQAWRMARELGCKA